MTVVIQVLILLAVIFLLAWGVYSVGSSFRAVDRCPHCQCSRAMRKTGERRSVEGDPHEPMAIVKRHVEIEWRCRRCRYIEWKSLGIIDGGTGGGF